MNQDELMDLIERTVRQQLDARLAEFEEQIKSSLRKEFEQKARSEAWKVQEQRSRDAVRRAGL